LRDLAKEKALRKQRADLHAEVVRMYKSGFGIRRIALKTGVSKTQTRKWLIDAGVYCPPAKSTKPAGEGLQSRYAILRKAKESKEAEELRRKIIAACLRGLRKQPVVPVERTCRDNGWNEKSVWNYLAKNPSYLHLREKLRRSQRWGAEMEKARRQGINSKVYRTETDFQDAVEAILVWSGFHFKREARLSGCRTRVDFLVGGNLYIECKVSCRAGQVYESMGQLLHYSVLSKERPVLLLPDDVALRADLAKIIAERIPATILYESQLKGFLKGQPTLPLAAAPPKPPNRSKPFKCKCCGLEGRHRSRGASGHYRSYCVDCEPVISDMEYDGRLDRWVKRRQLSLLKVEEIAGADARVPVH
jgi:hypothetical protein